MCGRFALTISPTALAKLFQLDDVSSLEASYNIAPSQSVASVVQPEDSSERILKLFRWGLIPHWAQDSAIGNRMINARSETVAEKPAFRSAYKSKRCLIPADGFYEWQKLTTGKQPWFIHLRDQIPMAFAGLYQHWRAPDDTVIESCTILTTAANDKIKPIHDRMPVIIDPTDFPLWLDNTTYKPKDLEKLLQPFPSDKMTTYPVSTFVNSPRNNSSQCLDQIESDTSSDKNLFDS